MGTLVLAVRFLSAESERPTDTCFLNSPSLFRLAYRLSPLCGSITVRLLVLDFAFAGIVSIRVREVRCV